MEILFETDRLSLRRLVLDDADFILSLVNEPSWLRFIGDRGVRTLDDARNYIRNGPQAMYAQHGFGLWLVQHCDDGAPMGMCGLLKRDTLDAPDIGFALLPAFWGQGYAFEAATATLIHAHDVFGLPRILAIASPDNDRSIRLLKRLGFDFDAQRSLDGTSPDVSVFRWAPGDRNGSASGPVSRIDSSASVSSPGSD